MRNLILLIDDDQNFVSALSDMLQFEEFRVITANNVKQGFRLIQTQHPDAIVCNYRLPYGLNGDKLLEGLRTSHKSNIPFVLTTTLAESIESLMPTAVLEKPFSILDLLDIIRTSLAENQAVSNPTH